MKNIILLGLVSFFADISAEMVYPIIPLYLTSSFGATPAIVGLIEGIAESLASLLKVFSGYITDKYQEKKKIAFLGYSTGLLYKLALIFAGSWVGILLARVIDRIGKGFRTAPRDVMVSESARSTDMGKAFGVHKSLDMAGSAIGIFIAYYLVKYFSGDYNFKRIFLISSFPVIIALMLFPFIKEKKNFREEKKRIAFWKNIKILDGQLKTYLLVAFLFSLGNSSNAFLLLRAKNIGFSDASVILLYFFYNITASILAIPFGKRSDKVGRKRVLVAGYILFSIVYLGFAFVTQKYSMLLLFILYGAYTAMIAGVERAFVAEISPKELKGTMLGLHSTLVGIALLPASVIAGLLWNNLDYRAPFVFGSLLSLISAMILLFFMKKRESVEYEGQI